MIFATSLDIYLFNSGVIEYRPAQLLVPLFLGLSLFTYKFERYLIVIKTFTFKLLLIYFILSILYSINSESSSTVIYTDIANKIITLLLYVMTMLFFYKNDEKFIKAFFVLSLMVLGLSIWYDLFFGLGYIQGNLRKGGFSANPNIGASALKFLGLCLIIVIKNKRVRLFIFLALASTIFITFSRSGFVSLIILFVLLIINQWEAKFNISSKKVISVVLKTTSLLLVSYFLLFNIANFIQNQVPEFSQGSVSKRIDLLLFRTDINDIISIDDKSQMGRETAALKFIELFKKNPFGYGSGYAGDVKLNNTNTHNYYLTSAIDFGFIGLLVLIWFFYSGFKSAIKFNYYYYFIFIILLFFECFISHGLFTEKAIIIALAFMDNKLYSIKNETA